MPPRASIGFTLGVCGVSFSQITDRSALRIRRSAERADDPFRAGALVSGSIAPMRSSLLMIAALVVVSCGPATEPPAEAPQTAASTATTATRATAKLTVFAGGGNLKSTPPGIECPSTCSADFPRGTVVTLDWTQTLAAGFGNFTVTEPGQNLENATSTDGNQAVVKMDGDREVRVSAVTIPPPPGGPPRH